MIIPIFETREKSSVLAHGFTHSVPGITLPPGDANLFFSLLLWLARGAKEKLPSYHILFKCVSLLSVTGFLAFL